MPLSLLSILKSQLRGDIFHYRLSNILNISNRFIQCGHAVLMTPYFYVNYIIYINNQKRKKNQFIKPIPLH